MVSSVSSNRFSLSASASAASFSALSQAINGAGGKVDLKAMAAIIADESGTYTDAQKYEAFKFMNISQKNFDGELSFNYLVSSANISKYTSAERQTYSQTVQNSSFMKRFNAAEQKVSDAIYATKLEYDGRSDAYVDRDKLARQAEFFQGLSDPFERMVLRADDRVKLAQITIGVLETEDKLAKQGKLNDANPEFAKMKALTAAGNKMDLHAWVNDSRLAEYLDLGRKYQVKQRGATVQDIVSLSAAARAVRI
ncbi:hypothetical protein ACFSM5_05045 [Lacibacterium aquatile]|uniref:DUF1217 domain-containing protein n=1 Tax=Lacibacterium aquatile TaxID=1168082 RepID=A0ABW5DQM1_9PROT